VSVFSTQGEEEQDREIFRIQFILQIFPLSSGEGLGERSNAKIKK
jgi:hypothetical protein